MGTGTYKTGDLVHSLSGNPQGVLRVVETLDLYVLTAGLPIPLQRIKVRQTDLPNGIVWSGRPDIIGGSLFDLYDTEVALVARAEDVP